MANPRIPSRAGSGIRNEGEGWQFTFQNDKNQGVQPELETLAEVPQLTEVFLHLFPSLLSSSGREDNLTREDSVISQRSTPKLRSSFLGNMRYHNLRPPREPHEERPQPKTPPKQQISRQMCDLHAENHHFF